MPVPEIFGAGPVLRGNSTEVHAPIDRRLSGWGLMRCRNGFRGTLKWIERGAQRDRAQVAERLMAADCKSAAPCELRRFESSPVHHELRGLNARKAAAG